MGKRRIDTLRQQRVRRREMEEAEAREKAKVNMEVIKQKPVIELDSTGKPKAKRSWWNCRKKS